MFPQTTTEVASTSSKVGRFKNFRSVFKTDTIVQNGDGTASIYDFAGTEFRTHEKVLLTGTTNVQKAAVLSEWVG